VLSSVTGESRNPWDAIKEQLRNQLSAESFENWISRTRYGGVNGRILQVLAPDQQTATYLRDEYTPRIDGLVRGLGLGLDAVVFLPVTRRVAGAKKNWALSSSRRFL